MYPFDASNIVIDSIVFGLQIEDMSLGRIGRDNTWALCVPRLKPALAAAP